MLARRVLVAAARVTPRPAAVLPRLLPASSTLMAPPFLSSRTHAATRSLSSSSSSSSTASSPSGAGAAFVWARRNLTLSNLKAHWPQIVAGSGALVVLYGISSASVHIATTLLELDMKQVFYGGFLTGVVTCGALGIAAVRAYRGMSISPDAVYRAALTKLSRNAVVREHIGGQVRSGHLKAYTVHPGHLSSGGTGTRFGWVEPRVQMLFQVVGDRGEGMATCEAVKHRGTVSFSVLALDTLARPGAKSTLILVAGREDKLHVRGTLRGFLQTERAQYVEQDKTEADEDRLAEQDGLAPGEAIVEGDGGDGGGEGQQQGGAAAAAAATKN
jgi:hypothetical protein